MHGIKKSQQILVDFGKLEQLSEEQFASLCDAIISAPLTLSMEEMSQYLVKNVLNLELNSAECILRLLVSIDERRKPEDIGGLEIIAQVQNALSPSLSTGADSTQTQKLGWDRLRKVFARPNRLNLISKALSVMYEHHNLFQEVRILTDIRPVFLDGPDSDSPALGAATVIHSLKVQYLNSTSPREIFLALDDEDLAKLENAVKRARIKSEKLQKFIEATDVPYLAIPVED